jgi:triacylglycerol lipase
VAAGTAGSLRGLDVVGEADLHAVTQDGRVSRRRRALLTALVALVAVAALATVVVLRTGRPVQPPAASPYPPQDQPGPVLLVPGYGGSTTSLEVLAVKLRAAGRQASVVALPGDGTGDLLQAARALDAAATAALAGGAPSVDVVGYSAGGVVARLWVRDLGGDRKARRVVTLGTPHHGTDVAALALAFAPTACPVACRQLVPGSDLLAALNREAVAPPGPTWLSLWSTQDDVVTPAESARLAGALDVALQDVCPGVQVTHGELPTTPLVAGLVLDSLGAGPLPSPGPAECGPLQAAGAG